MMDHLVKASPKKEIIDVMCNDETPLSKRSKQYSIVGKPGKGRESKTRHRSIHSPHSDPQPSARRLVHPSDSTRHYSQNTAPACPYSSTTDSPA